MLQGKSFSIGGDTGANTITNWLKNYNNDIIGMSVGSHFAEVPNDVVTCTTNCVAKSIRIMFVMLCILYMQTNN